MSWISDTLNSSLGKKLVMATTGLFLVIFLVAHLAGNVSLLFDDGGVAFNSYAHFMKHNKLIVASEVILFLGFIFHIVQGIKLVMANKSARPTAYAMSSQTKTENKNSKYMGPFGLVILAFLVLHLIDFFRFKYFSTPPSMIVEGEEIADLYVIVKNTYQGSILHVIIYPVAMAVIGFHLNHGFQSAFQSLGINHPKYTPTIKCIGTAYSIAIPLAFALIPILIYVGVSF